MSEQRGRRYDWIEYEDGTILGQKRQCRSKLCSYYWQLYEFECIILKLHLLDKIKVDSWWRWLVWHCSYCVCKCDQQGPDSDRYDCR